MTLENPYEMSSATILIILNIGIERENKKSKRGEMDHPIVSDELVFHD